MAVFKNAPPNTDAFNFFSAANITNTNQCVAIATLTSNLKNYGLWNKMQVIYPFVGGNAASHGYNLKDPRPVSSAFYMTFNGGTHNSLGFTSNGTSGYGLTNFNPSVNLLDVSSSHISIYVPIYNNNDGYDFGNGNGGTFSMTLRAPWQQLSVGLGGVGATISDGIAQGYFVGSRTGTNVSMTRYSSSFTTTSTGTGTAYSYPNINATLGAPVDLGYGGVVRTYSFLTIGSGLTTRENSILNSIVQQYQTTLGRQV